MTDDHSVVEQFNDIIHILNQFSQHKLNMDEEIKVSSIIDKLPPFWKDQRKLLKQKKEDMSLDSLAQCLQVE